MSSPPDISLPLPWHGDAWRRVSAQVAAGRLPPALLLAGAAGSGKGQFARALARLLLCHQPADGLNCGHCQACVLSRAGNHGDLLELQPEGSSRVIKIEQVRQLVEFCSQTAGFGQRKVVLFDPAEAMTINAANALLKALEEPAAGTHMLLVSHRPLQLPATVRSRCQLLRLPDPGREDALAWLDNHTGDRATSERLLQLADGHPLAAAALQQDTEAAAALRLTRQLLDQLGAAAVTPGEAAEALTDMQPEQLLQQLVSLLQARLRSANGDVLRSREGRELFRMLDEVQRWRAALDAGVNPNRQLLIDQLLTSAARRLGG